MKRYVQSMMLIIVLPLYAVYWLLAKCCEQDSLWQTFMQFLSLLPGKVGSYLRVAFARLTMNYCDPDVFLGFGVVFSHCDTDINCGTYIGPQCNIGKCSIGRNTLLGSGVHVLSGKRQHDFSDPTIPIKDQGGVFEKIVIGNNCWVGNHAVIMASVGDNSIVAAGAVVTDTVPEGVIVGGNPAKMLKKVGE